MSILHVDGDEALGFITRGQVKFFLCFTHSLTSVLDGGEWSASHPGRFTPREGAADTHWIGGWVGPRSDLDTVS
jgi:hypothetical protein